MIAVDEQYALTKRTYWGVAERRLASTLVNSPGRSGGGTVFYVTQTHHRFLSNRIIERYEGETPNVVGIFRLGLLCLKFKRRDAEKSYRKLALVIMTTPASPELQQQQQLPPTLFDYEVATQTGLTVQLLEDDSQFLSVE